MAQASSSSMVTRHAVQGGRVLGIGELNAMGCVGPFPKPSETEKDCVNAAVPAASVPMMRKGATILFIRARRKLSGGSDAVNPFVLGGNARSRPRSARGRLRPSHESAI